MQESKPHIQHKPYATSPKWLSKHGHVCLNKIPLTCKVIFLASISQLDDRELKALEEFILLKERHIVHHMNVKKYLQAIDEASQLISYLKLFPSNDRTNDLNVPFWSGSENLLASLEPSSAQSDLPDLNIFIFLQSLPNVIVTSYFGPRS